MGLSLTFKVYLKRKKIKNKPLLEVPGKKSTLMFEIVTNHSVWLCVMDKKLAS